MGKLLSLLREMWEFATYDHQKIFEFYLQTTENDVFGDFCDFMPWNRYEKGYVYLVKGSHGLYKIGISILPKDRFSQIKSAARSLGLPDFEIEVISIIPCYRARVLESMLHDLFASKRVSGEWFSLHWMDIEAFKYLEERR